MASPLIREITQGLSKALSGTEIDLTDGERRALDGGVGVRFEAYGCMKEPEKDQLQRDKETALEKVRTYLTRKYQINF